MVQIHFGGLHLLALYVIIVKEIENCIGITFDPSAFSWPNGIALSLNPSGIIASGNDLAHELGHTLSLTNPSPPIHADDDPDDKNKKEDIWSLRRLMYSYNSYEGSRAGDNWAQNVGYGKIMRGSMVTIRHLNNNATDDECNKARIWAKPPKRVYST